MATSMIICLTVSCVSMFLSVICLMAALFAIIELRSFNKSTHKIEWMPLESSQIPGKDPETNDVLKEYDLI